MIWPSLCEMKAWKARPNKMGHSLFRTPLKRCIDPLTNRLFGFFGFTLLLQPIFFARSSLFSHFFAGAKPLAWTGDAAGAHKQRRLRKSEQKWTVRALGGTSAC